MRIPEFRVIVVVIFWISMAIPSHAFEHPGILHTRKDIERMRSIVVNKEQPAYACYELLENDPRSKADYVMIGPFRQLYRGDVNGTLPSIQGKYESDFNAAYQNAVMFAVTQKEAHARKSVEILVAYADSVEIIGRDQPLLAGIMGVKIMYAAELMRYLYPLGMTDSKFSKVCGMFRQVFVPILEQFYRTPAYSNGNWGAAVNMSYMAAAVLLDDELMYQKALDFYVAGNDNGNILNYVDGETGQCQESGRDQAHSQLGLACLAVTCEMAWKQGMDLYGVMDNRLLKGFEYTSRYNVGYDDLPFRQWKDITGKYNNWKVISLQTRGRFRPVYEMTYNHYVNRRGLDMPYTRKVLDKIRPEGYFYEHFGFGTFLFHDKPMGPQSVGHSLEYNILDFGATRDTMELQTQAINAAIEYCYNQGGGKVIIPSGKFRSGTIFLKDRVELHLANGACLYASDQSADFPVQPRASYRSLKDAGGWVALIYAVGARHISITGSGVIDGRGRGRKGTVQGFGGDRDGRPRNILFISCKGVRVSGITMRNAAMWNQHYLDCEDVMVDHIEVYNHCNGNNDGIDIDGCRRFILSNSIIDSDDDGIVLKSTGTAACENVVISNCIVSSFANAIKCGTESTGGFKNILISDCVVKPSRHTGVRILKSTPSGITGISLEMVDGGVMDGVVVNNVIIEGTECPLYVRLANRGRKHAEEADMPQMGKMKNIRISNLTAYGTGNFCSSITGLSDGKIENIYLNNLRFINRGGLVKGNCRSVEGGDKKRHDVGGSLHPDQYWSSFQEVKEDEKGYPQPTVWGNLPSLGLFIRNVEEVVVEQATFKSARPDPRIPIIAVNVGYLQLEGIHIADKKSIDVLLHQVADTHIEKTLKVKVEK